jgi:hypothetical protein
LTDLERWESFGQHHARVQLCERAEAAAKETLDAPQLAREVQKLRDEWKALDQQHAGVPKALWERFDRGCEKAYAPAARHFAEVAAQRKAARKQREDFIAAAGERATQLFTEPRDWRAIERALRETDQAWREGNLGSVEPGAWKKLDARLRAALAPVRDALTQAREQAKAARRTLIDEATALVPKAMQRDVPSQVKAIQARWQEQAKAMSLAQRDERALWEEFRAACDAVFEARQSRRREEDSRKSEGRRALEELCAEVERLAHAGDKDEQEIRRTLRDLQEQWKHKSSGTEPGMAGLESRFRNARSAVDGMLTARARSREAAVWTTLAAKERLCEEQDALVRSSASTGDAAAQAAVGRQRWDALPALPTAWEKQLAARRDAALHALAQPDALAACQARIEQGAGPRREILLELEMALGLPSPAELQPQRLALQVQQLRNRFQDATTAGTRTPAERLVAWCAAPGITEAGDRERSARIFAAVERLR